MKLLIAVICCALALPGARGQNERREEFEVAVVKRVLPGDGVRPGLEKTPERLSARLPLSFLITEAFGIERWQLKGLTGWMESDTYSIAAKAATPVDSERMKAMLRNLLVDRFQLKLRSEVRHVPAFALAVDSNGPKLQPPSDDESDPPWASDEELPLQIAGTMEELTRFINSRTGPAAVGRPVVNRTGIQGTYKIVLTFGNVLDPGGRGGKLSIDLPSALRRELGLKLEPTTADVKYWIVDSAVRPREDN